jgi:beta-galactosidase
MTFSDGQCSCLGNCTTSWGAKNTQTVISNDRDCPFSQGQYIWTGWDYIGEPTPYHSKSSFFGQIDTAGFPKDTFYLYKSEWQYKNTTPFVHLLPYWDWNEGQLIDIKAYTNMDSVELFFNGISQGKQDINHKNGKEPYGCWQIEYHKGEIKAVAYDDDGNVVAEETKKSFGDPAKILLKPEIENYGNLHFIQIMTLDEDGILVENARNYITINVKGDAELLGMDNGDSTDYDEYKPKDGKTHTRRLFSNRLIAIVNSKNENSSFEITAASKGLPNISMRYNDKQWSGVSPDNTIKPDNEFIPTRKIELIAHGSTKMNKSNLSIEVTAKVLPEKSIAATLSGLKTTGFLNYLCSLVYFSP